MTHSAIAKQILKTAQDLLPAMRLWRRDFHQHPELSGREKRTSSKVASILRDLELEVQTDIGGYGVLGLSSGKVGQTVALRADMDALPLTETSSLSYASQTPGVMHACGHDGHTAMLLGAAAIISKLPPLPGIVKFIFQPAEETTQGAEAMIADGVMRDPEVEAVFALHLQPALKFGSLALSEGPSMAASSFFAIQVEGKGGHGAHPNLAVDPLPAAHQIYAALQTIRRGLSPTDPCVLSVCAFNGGQARNVIPADVKLMGTLRTYTAATQSQAKNAIAKIVHGIAAAFAVKSTVTFSGDTPAVNNAPLPTEIMRQSAEALCMPVEAAEAVMTSEDFSFFQKKAPGVLGWLGTRQEPEFKKLHTPDFDFDDSVLPQGAAVLAACAWNFLRQ